MAAVHTVALAHYGTMAVRGWYGGPKTPRKPGGPPTGPV